MNIDEFFSRLDGYFQKNELDKAAPFLTDSLEKAKEAEDYASYITIGNEMIGFYRSVSMFREAFDIAEDVLLLMEELQLGESEHFATTLVNTATAYRAAGKPQQALQYYRQALQIYGRLLPEGDYRFAGEVIALQKRVDDRRCYVPPDGEPDKHDVVLSHICHAAGDFRAGRRVVHLRRTAALFVRPVQVLRGVGNGGPDFMEIRPSGLRQSLCQPRRHAAGGKIRDQNLCHGDILLFKAFDVRFLNSSL